MVGRLTTFGKYSEKIIYKTIEKLLTNAGIGSIIKVEIKERATARKECKMTRQEMIKKLEEIKEEVDWDNDGELTDYAREKAYICIDQAIEHLQENYGAEDD